MQIFLDRFAEPSISPLARRASVQVAPPSSDRQTPAPKKPLPPAAQIVPPAAAIWLIGQPSQKGPARLQP